MRIDHFTEWKTDIQSYCEYMNFDFKKLEKMAKGNGLDFLIFGLLEEDISSLTNDTPAPTVLIVFKTEKGLEYRTTEYTELYLKKIS